MLCEVEIHGNLSISKDFLENEVVRKSSVLTRLMKELQHIKSTQRHGYFIAITKLKSFGNGELEEETQNVLFPISFSCRTFLPVKGEIMLGVVYEVHSLGVFLRCGPMNVIYLSSRKMPNFSYVQSGEQGMFVRDDLARIQNGVVVRFVVFAVRWGRARSGIQREREFKVLASIEGDDGLGPVSLSGNDELDL